MYCLYQFTDFDAGMFPVLDAARDFEATPLRFSVDIETAGFLTDSCKTLDKNDSTTSHTERAAWCKSLHTVTG